MFSANRIYLLLVVISMLVTGCRTDNTPPFQYRINPAIQPFVSSLPDEAGGIRPLAAIRDDQGVVSEYVANELIISTPSQAVALAVANRYGGRILFSDAVPPPLPNFDIDVNTNIPTVATSYVVRLNEAAINSVNLAGIETELEEAGIGGSAEVSSELGMKILAIAGRESLRGNIQVAPNWVSQPTNNLRSTQEQPSGASSFLDGFTFRRMGTTGSKLSATLAWQFIDAFQSLTATPSIRVAILDGGFWLDTAGRPMSDPATSGLSDLPSNPSQYDFHGDDYIADGQNPSSCTGGSPCPWHGNNSASVAVAAINNQSGAVSTGGLVAQPILFKTDLSDGQVRRAVRTAASWNADVLSMSFGGSCNWFCRQWRSINSYYSRFNEANNARVVMLAAAGNNSQDSTDQHVHPCTVGHVICVGAVADEGNTRISYSNFGSNLDIWAPSNYLAMPHGASGATLPNAGGTSSSTPAVAGIAAMMKAMNRSLNSDQVRDMLRIAAWTDSTDSNVTHYANAYWAVHDAAGGNLPRDRFENNDTPSAARALGAGTHANLTLHSGSDLDYYQITMEDYGNLQIDLEYLRSIGSITMIFTSVTGGTAMDVVDSSLPTGRRYAVTSLPPGTYRLRIGAGTLTRPNGTNVAVPNLYNLVITKNLTGLELDQFDRVALNQNFATASTLPLGDFDVNLHNNSDVDFYRVTNTSLEGVTQAWVEIPYHDQSLVMIVYNDAGTEVGRVSTGDLRLVLPAGSSYVRVSGGVRGRYGISTYNALTEFPPFLVPIDVVKWVWPGPDPTPGFLTGDRDIFVFEPNLQMPIAGMQLAGAGLHLTLVNGSGQTIGEGRYNSDREAQAGIETLLLGNTNLDGRSRYYLIISRHQQGNGQDSNLQAVQSYRLGFGFRQ